MNKNVGESMYKNVGKSMMMIAVVVCIAGMVAAGLGGLTMILSGEPTFIYLGFLVIVVGALLAWLSGLSLYAFGNLVDNVQTITKKLEEQGTWAQTIGVQNNESMSAPTAETKIKPVQKQDTRPIMTCSSCKQQKHVTKVKDKDTERYLCSDCFYAEMGYSPRI